MAKRECGNAQNMKYENRLRVLQMIATGGPLSRASITAATGLSKMSISNITGDLICAGLVNETPSTDSHSGISGRIPLLLELSPLSPCVMGLYIGRRHCTVLVMDLSAKIVTEKSYQYSENMTGPELLEITAALCENAVKVCPRKILCIGIASLGPVNAQTGVIISPPNFFGIRDLPIREHLQTQLRLPCFLIHDAPTGALAEFLYGSCREDNEFICKCKTVLVWELYSTGTFMTESSACAGNWAIPSSISGVLSAPAAIGAAWSSTPRTPTDGKFPEPWRSAAPG